MKINWELGRERDPRMCTSSQVICRRNNNNAKVCVPGNMCASCCPFLALWEVTTTLVTWTRLWLSSPHQNSGCGSGLLSVLDKNPWCFSLLVHCMLKVCKTSFTLEQGFPRLSFLFWSAFCHYNGIPDQANFTKKRGSQFGSFKDMTNISSVLVSAPSLCHIMVGLLDGAFAQIPC